MKPFEFAISKQRTCEICDFGKQFQNFREINASNKFGVNFRIFLEEKEKKLVKSRRIIQNPEDKLPRAQDGAKKRSSSNQKPESRKYARYLVLSTSINSKE